MTHLSRGRTIAYSFGQLAAGLYFAFNNFTLPLYLSLFTQNNILIGWLSSTRSFEQSIIQPLVGARSDRTWTRFGRRAPFFLATMPIVALLLIVNGVLPHDPALLWIVVVTIFVFSLLFNVGIDPYYALLVDVTHPKQRGTVNGIAQVFGFLGQFGILIAAAFLWGVHPFWVFSTVAAGLVIGFGIVAFGVREPRALVHAGATHTRPATDASAVTNRSVATFARYLAELFHAQREAVKLLGVKFLYQFGINAAMPFLTLFVVEEIGLNGWPDMLAAFPWLASLGLDKIEAQGLSQLMAAVLLLVTALCAVPCGVMGDRFGKKKIFALGLFVMGAMALLAAFATTIPQLLFYLLFIGFGNSALTVLFGPYLANLIPAERVGEFTGLAAFAETGGVFLSILLAGELINLNLFGLKYRMIFIITGLFLLLGLIAVSFVKARLTSDEAGREISPAVATTGGS